MKNRRNIDCGSISLFVALWMENNNFYCWWVFNESDRDGESREKFCRLQKRNKNCTTDRPLCESCLRSANNIFSLFFHLPGSLSRDRATSFIPRVDVVTDGIARVVSSFSSRPIFKQFFVCDYFIYIRWIFLCFCVFLFQPNEKATKNNKLTHNYRLVMSIPIVVTSVWSLVVIRC